MSCTPALRGWVSAEDGGCLSMPRPLLYMPSAEAAVVLKNPPSEYPAAGAAP